MTRAAAARAAGSSRPGNAGQSKFSYLNESERPLVSLLFLLPLIVIYEVGIHLSYSRPLHAFTLLQDFFRLFGATGQHLPALAVIGILLTWHIARKDSWRVRGSTLFAMTLESVILGVPVVIFGLVLVHYLPLLNDAAAADLPGLIVLSCGAGVYEELVFRLGGLTLLSLVLIDFLDLRKALAIPLMVLFSSAAFALYHYLGTEAFEWRSFAFRSGAGVYFSVVFLLRGFGITAATHSAYDIIIVSLAAGMPK